MFNYKWELEDEITNLEDEISTKAQFMEECESNGDEDGAEYYRSEMETLKYNLYDYEDELDNWEYNHPDEEE